MATFGLTRLCQPKSLMWSLRCIISITLRSEGSVFLWAWHASPRAISSVYSSADYSFWWKRVWSVSGVDERWNEKGFSDISAWCLWVSECEFQALLWFCHNKEVLISAGFSKQMCLCVRVCAWLRYECLSYWYRFAVWIGCCLCLFLNKHFLFLLQHFYFISVSNCAQLQFLRDQRSQTCSASFFTLLG